MPRNAYGAAPRFTNTSDVFMGLLFKTIQDCFFQKEATFKIAGHNLVGQNIKLDFH